MARTRHLPRRYVWSIHRDRTVSHRGVLLGSVRQVDGGRWVGVNRRGEVVTRRRPTAHEAGQGLIRWTQRTQREPGGQQELPLRRGRGAEVVPDWARPDFECVWCDSYYYDENERDVHQAQCPSQSDVRAWSHLDRPIDKPQTKGRPAWRFW